MKTYTKEDVIRLLKEQREICYQSAKIIEHEYVNPYSESDGQITRIISKESIVDAKLPELNIAGVMPRLICHYNEREGGYLTIGKIYQAISIDEDGWMIKDDSGDYNIYSSAYLNEA